MKMSMITKNRHKLLIVDRESDEIVEETTAIPVCGNDLCEECGDCIHCFGGNECAFTKDKQHVWMRYGDE